MPLKKTAYTDISATSYAGGVQNTVGAVADDGAITIPTASKTFFITKASACAMTLADPTTGTHDGIRLTFVATTAYAHTIDNEAGSGFNAGGGTKDAAVFGGAKGDAIELSAYLGKWYVIGNINVTIGTLASASVSPSVSPSISPSRSVSPSVSPSISPSGSASPSGSVSASASPSVSPSASVSESASSSVSPSVSLSISPSGSESPSSSVSASASV